MTLREQQAQLTSDTILDAAEELIFSDADPSTITMQGIAERAGVSHRTLYRHFASRDALISAVGQRMDERSNVSAGIREPESFDDWINGTEVVVRFGTAHRDVLRRALALGITTGMWRRDRDERYFELFRERFPNLDDETAHEDFAALRTLLGSSSVISMGERFELSGEALARSLQRAVDALVADVEERNRSEAG